MKVDLSGDSVLSRVRGKVRSVAKKNLRAYAMRNVKRKKHTSIARAEGYPVPRPGSVRRKISIQGRQEFSARRAAVPGMVRRKNAIRNIARSKIPSFHGLSADEIIYVMENSPNPELMGSALKDFAKRAKKKVHEVKKKLAKKYKAMPKWAKVLTAPLALATAPALLPAVLPRVAAVGTVKAVRTLTNKKKRQALAAKVKAAIKKMPKPLRIAAGMMLAPLAPITTMTALTTGTALAPAIIAKKRAEAKRKQIAAAAAASRGKVTTTARVKGAVVNEQSAADIENGSGNVSVAMVKPQPQEFNEPQQATTAPAPVAPGEGDTGEQTTEKKPGSGLILPIAAAAALLPFIL